MYQSGRRQVKRWRIPSAWEGSTWLHLDVGGNLMEGAVRGGLLYPFHHFHLKLHSLTISLAHRMLVLAPILLAATLVQAEAEAEAEADPAILAHGYAEVAYCANGGYCVPPVHCAPYYLESLYDPAAPCYLAHGTPGVCCPPKKAPCK